MKQLHYAKQFYYREQYRLALPGVLQGFILCLLLLQAGAYLVGWHGLFISPGDLDYAERWHAYVASQAFPGGNHVTSAYEMPYNTLPYPPLSYLLHGWIGKLMGANLLGIRTIGRATSLIATFSSTGLIILISRTLGVRLFWCLIAGLLFLTSRSAHFFAVSLRPDEIACAIMLLGLFTVVRWRNYWIAGIIFAIAIAAKHSFITVPLVLIVSLLLKRDVRSVVKFVAGGCLTGLAIAVLATWMLGPYWWQGSLLQGFHGADIKQMIFFIGEGFKQPILIIALACLILADFSGSIALIAASFAVSLFLNSVMLVKVGAAANYFLEPVSLAAILVAYVAEKQLGERQFPQTSAAWVLVLALLVPPTVNVAIEATHMLKGKTGLGDVQTALIQRASRVKGPILTDSSALYFDSNHQPFVSPPDLMMAAIEGGKVNDQSILNFIAEREFELVVVRQNWKEFRHFPLTWIDAIEKTYQSSGTVDGFIVLEPKSISKS